MNKFLTEFSFGQSKCQGSTSDPFLGLLIWFGLIAFGALLVKSD